MPVTVKDPELVPPKVNVPTKFLPVPLKVYFPFDGLKVPPLVFDKLPAMEMLGLPKAVKVPPIMVRSPPKANGTAFTDAIMLPPVLMVTLPVKVFKPVPVNDSAPLMMVVPVIVRVVDADKAAPASTCRLAPTLALRITEPEGDAVDFIHKLPTMAVGLRVTAILWPVQFQVIFPNV